MSDDDEELPFRVLDEEVDGAKGKDDAAGGTPAQEPLPSAPSVSTGTGSAESVSASLVSADGTVSSGSLESPSLVMAEQDQPALVSLDDDVI
jgi:hypothetical protein